MPTGAEKRHQLDEILSDKISVMETDEVADDSGSLEEPEAKPGFCVECKDQEVMRQCIVNFAGAHGQLACASRSTYSTVF